MGFQYVTAEDVEVQQAIALHWPDVVRCARHAGVDPDRVEQVKAVMDEVLLEEPPRVLGARAPRRHRVQPCGTHAAYQRHLQHGETPCGPCAQAQRDYNTAARRAAS